MRREHSDLPLTIVGRADFEVIVLLACTIVGFIAGYWLGGGIVYGLVGAVACPLAVAVFVVAASYVINRWR
jgi:hypothetical protein